MYNWRLLLAGLFLLLSVLVDFASKFLSVASDAVIVGAAVYFLWPVIKGNGKE